MGFQQEEIQEDAEEIRRQEEDRQGRPSFGGTVPNWSYSGGDLFSPRPSRSRRRLHPRRQRARVLHQEAQGQEGQINAPFLSADCHRLSMQRLYWSTIFYVEALMFPKYWFLKFEMFVKTKKNKVTLKENYISFNFALHVISL